MKWVATMTMFIDHLTVALSTTVNDLYYIVGRSIGRIAFPLYALLFVDSFFYTSSRTKYIKKLGIFALISEIPYDLTFNNRFLEFSDQNILFLFVAMSLLLMCVTELNIQTNSIPFWLLILFVGIGTTILNIDYAIFGIIYMGIIYHIRTQEIKPLEIIMYLMIGLLFQAPFSFIVIPLILLYNEKEQQFLLKIEKNVFYFFYPLHIIAIFMIQALIL